MSKVSTDDVLLLPPPKGWRRSAIKWTPAQTQTIETERDVVGLEPLELVFCVLFGLWALWTSLESILYPDDYFVVPDGVSYRLQRWFGQTSSIPVDIWKDAASWGRTLTTSTTMAGTAWISMALHIAVSWKALVPELKEKALVFLVLTVFPAIFMLNTSGYRIYVHVNGCTFVPAEGLMFFMTMASAAAHVIDRPKRQMPSATARRPCCCGISVYNCTWRSWGRALPLFYHATPAMFWSLLFPLLQPYPAGAVLATISFILLSVAICARVIASMLSALSSVPKWCQRSPGDTQSGFQAFLARTAAGSCTPLVVQICQDVLIPGSTAFVWIFLLWPSPSDGCPAFAMPGRGADGASPPAGMHWPEGMDVTSPESRTAAVAGVILGAIVSTGTAMVVFGVALTTILEALSSDARLREAETTSSADTLRQAIGYVSHGARGPLNAAMLSLALLHQAEHQPSDNTGSSFATSGASSAVPGSAIGSTVAHSTTVAMKLAAPPTMAAVSSGASLAELGSSVAGASAASDTGPDVTAKPVHSTSSKPGDEEEEEEVKTQADTISVDASLQAQSAVVGGANIDASSASMTQRVRGVSSASSFVDATESHAVEDAAHTSASSSIVSAGATGYGVKEASHGSAGAVEESQPAESSHMAESSHRPKGKELQTTTGIDSRSRSESVRESSSSSVVQHSGKALHTAAAAAARSSSVTGARGGTLDELNLIRELRASIQESKRRLDGLLLWEKSQGSVNQAADAVSWEWDLLGKRWRSRIYKAFSGACETTGTTLGVSTGVISTQAQDLRAALAEEAEAGGHGGGHDSTTREGHTLVEVAAGKTTTSSINKTTVDPFGSTTVVVIASPTRDSAPQEATTNDKDVQATATNLHQTAPQPLGTIMANGSLRLHTACGSRAEPADAFEIYADHDRVLAVCTSTLSFAMDRTSAREAGGRVVLQCSILTDATVTDRFAYPVQTPKANSSEARGASRSSLTPRARKHAMRSTAGVHSARRNRITGSASARDLSANLSPPRGILAENSATGQQDATAARGSVARGSGLSPIWSRAGSSRVSRHAGESLMLTGKGVESAVLQIEVLDDGPALSADDVSTNRVFKPFGGARRQDGAALDLTATGLGLATVRSIVVAGMRGEVGIAAGKKSGALVYARVPVWVRRRTTETPRATADRTAVTGSSAADAMEASSSRSHVAGRHSEVSVSGSASHDTTPQSRSDAATPQSGFGEGTRAGPALASLRESHGSSSSSHHWGNQHGSATTDESGASGPEEKHLSDPSSGGVIAVRARGGSSHQLVPSTSHGVAHVVTASGAATATGTDVVEPQLPAAAATTASEATVTSTRRGDRAASKKDREARRRQRMAQRAAAKQAEAGADLTDTAAQHATAARQPLVWVCDDDRMIVQLMQANLGRLKLRSQPFYDGSEILDRLKQCSADPSLERPAVLLLDNLMPRVSGVQVLREKATMCHEECHAWLADLSVIIMSGEASVAAKQEFRGAGAHAVVSKPVEISIVVEELQTLGVLESTDDEADEDAR